MEKEVRCEIIRTQSRVFKAKWWFTCWCLRSTSNAYVRCPCGKAFNGIVPYLHLRYEKQGFSQVRCIYIALWYQGKRRKCDIADALCAEHTISSTTDMSQFALRKALHVRCPNWPIWCTRKLGVAPIGVILAHVQQAGTFQHEVRTELKNLTELESDLQLILAL